MTETSGKYSDFEGLREQAIALRREGLSLRQIRDRLKIFNNDLLNRLLKGEPAPEWTRRPRAKDELRAKARELRVQGMTYDQIQLELGCSKSSISLWVRDLPTPPRRAREDTSAIAKRAWAPILKQREAERQQTKRDATAEIGTLSKRELFLLGVGLYWAEGTKAHGGQERVTFINSDRNMINIFLAWLHLLDVDKGHLRFHVHIHESADVLGAEQFWAALVGEGGSFGKTTLKRHKPQTNRQNTGADYHGCLAIRVNKSADLYRRIEGWWYGIVLSADPAT